MRYPSTLDLSHYCKANLDTHKTKYNLIGVVVHWGTLERGHYISIIRKQIEGKDRWFYCNDKNIAECEERHALSQEAYVLLLSASPSQHNL